MPGHILLERAAKTVRNRIDQNSGDIWSAYLHFNPFRYITIYREDKIGLIILNFLIRTAIWAWQGLF